MLNGRNFISVISGSLEILEAPSRSGEGVTVSSVSSSMLVSWRGPHPLCLLPCCSGSSLSVALCLLIHATLRSIRSCLKFSHNPGLWKPQRVCLRTFTCHTMLGTFLGSPQEREAQVPSDLSSPNLPGAPSFLTQPWPKECRAWESFSKTHFSLVLLFPPWRPL